MPQATRQILLGSLRNRILSAICLHFTGMNADFSVQGVRSTYWGPISRGWNEILQFGTAQKFGVIFQKYALKLIKIWKLLRGFECNREKCKVFGNFFNFREEHYLFNMGKIMNIIWTGYIGGRFGPAKVEKLPRNPMISAM